MGGPNCSLPAARALPPCPPCNTINWDVAQAADISSDVEERDREAMLAKVIVNCYLCRHMCVESVIDSTVQCKSIIVVK